MDLRGDKGLAIKTGLRLHWQRQKHCAGRKRGNEALHFAATVTGQAVIGTAMIASNWRTTAA